MLVSAPLHASPPFPPQAPRCLTRARLHAPLEQWLTLQAALAAKQVTPIAVPIATVPVYYSTPVYYYDTSVSICALWLLADAPCFLCPPVAFGEPLGTAKEEMYGVVTGLPAAVVRVCVHTVRECTPAGVRKATRGLVW